jgi:hypothetical protein
MYVDPESTNVLQLEYTTLVVLEISPAEDDKVSHFPRLRSLGFLLP